MILVSKSWGLGCRDGLCVAFKGVLLQFVLGTKKPARTFTFILRVKSTHMVAVTPKKYGEPALAGR